MPQKYSENIFERHFFMSEEILSECFDDIKDQADTDEKKITVGRH